MYNYSITQTECKVLLSHNNIKVILCLVYILFMLTFCFGTRTLEPVEPLEPLEPLGPTDNASFD